MPNLLPPQPLPESEELAKQVDEQSLYVSPFPFDATLDDLTGTEGAQRGWGNCAVGEMDACTRGGTGQCAGSRRARAVLAAAVRPLQVPRQQHAPGPGGSTAAELEGDGTTGVASDGAPHPRGLLLQSSLARSAS